LNEVTMSAAPKLLRRQLLIKPAFQWRTSLVFVALACIAVLLQVMALSFRLSDAAGQAPGDGTELAQRVPEVVLESALLTLGVVLPLMIAIGILLTFRIAGPIHRFERHLEQLLRGEHPGPCQIREHDEFHELCGLLNRYVESRSHAASPSAAGAPGPGALEQTPAPFPSTASSRERQSA
jgi:hypothetical protein